MAEKSARDGHKGYAEESMGEPPPLTAVEEMNGAAQRASSCSLLSFIFVERWESVLYPIFSGGANKFACCIRDKVERRVFLAFPPRRNPAGLGEWLARWL